MKNLKKYSIIGLVVLCFISIITLSLLYVSAGNIAVKKLMGSDRYATAVALSQKQFVRTDTVSIVNGNALADGLTITPLATYYNSPILLSYTDRLPQSTKDEIKRLGAKKVFIGGSEGVVSQNVVKELKSLGIQEVIGLGGKDRYGEATLQS